MNCHFDGRCFTSKKATRLVQCWSCWGKRGSDAGEFAFTIGLAVSSASIVYVTDEGGKRLQAFRILALPEPAVTPSV